MKRRISPLLVILFLSASAHAQPTALTPGERVHVTPAPEQRDFAAVNVVTVDLGRGVYVLGAGDNNGSNVVLAVGDDAAVLIDAQFAQVHDKLRAAIAAVTNRPVRYVINTHHRNDHTSGNALFAKEGAIIVAHENMNKNVQMANTPSDPAGLATETFEDRRTLQLGRQTIELRHPAAPVVTDADTYIYFRGANVLATGDIFYSRPGFPNLAGVVATVGGGINGVIAGVDELIALADDRTKVVPGHGAVSNRAGMMAFRDFLNAARTRVAHMIAEGKTVEEAIAAKSFRDYQEKWGVVDERTDDGTAATFTRTVYEDLRNRVAR